MIKNYITSPNNVLDDDEISFVEEVWSRNLLSSCDVALEADLTQREEYQALLPILENIGVEAEILDGGCGRGEWTVFLSRLGYQTTGMDISAKLISALQKSFPDCNFLRGDIRHTGCEDESFSLYFSWGAFEHFEIGLSPCLHEAYRVLKPGGHLVFSVPFASGRLKKRHEIGLVKQFYNSPSLAEYYRTERFYQWRFTIGELAREICLAGFTPLHVYPIDKDEGLRRMLYHDMGLRLQTGSILETLFLKVLRVVMPKKYVNHMVIAIAEKRRPEEKS